MSATTNTLDGRSTGGVAKLNKSSHPASPNYSARSASTSRVPSPAEDLATGCVQGDRSQLIASAVCTYLSIVKGTYLGTYPASRAIANDEAMHARGAILSQRLVRAPSGNASRSAAQHALKLCFRTPFRRAVHRQKASRTSASVPSRLLACFLRCAGSISKMAACL